MKWINENKQWLFSGIGVVIATLVITLAFRFFSPEHSVRQQEFSNEVKPSDLRTTRTPPETNIADQVNEPVRSAIFDHGNPIPVDFAELKLGLSLSQVKALRPEGRISGSNFQFNPDTGAFYALTFHFEEGNIDPIVKSITYFVRNKEWRKVVKRELVASLSDYTVTPEMLGEDLRWDAVGKYSVHLSDQYYTVSIIHGKH